MEKKLMMLGTVGNVTLDEIEFCDDILDVYIGIKDVSDNLKDKIEQTVNKAKAESRDYMMKLYGRDWIENTHVILSLHVAVNIYKKSLSTSINVLFEEPCIEGDYTSGEFGSGEFEIDLSEYENELKKIIVKGIISKFF